MRVNAAFNDGDLERVLADFHPDAEWRDLMHAPDVPECVRGIAAIHGIWTQWQEAFDEFTAEIEECVDAGERVVGVTHWRATGKGSGLASDLRAAEVYEFEDGRIVRVTLGYADKAAALEAVGLWR